MITLFAIPKPFRGHIGTIQRNALESWVRVNGIDVVLFGDEHGVAEVAAEVGCQHIGGLETSEYGTPLISSAFKRARQESHGPLLGYANADIILLSDFREGLEKVHLEQFLLIGQRWNVDVQTQVDFEDPSWARQLRNAIERDGELSGHRWIDYFVLPRDSPIIDEMPPFVVGRPRWDNWMIRQARLMHIPVIDGTRQITAIHQRHDYGHVPGGSGERWAGPEADANADLYGPGQHFGTWHATHVLASRGPARAIRPKYLRRRWETRDEADGRLERLSRRVDPALQPVRWIYRRTRSRGPSGAPR